MGSIRFRLTVWYAAVLTAGLVVFGASLWWLLQHRLFADLDQDLDNRASRFENYFREEAREVSSDAQLRDELNEFCQALPDDSYVMVRSASGFRFRFPEAQPGGSGLRMVERRFEATGDQFDLEVGTPTAEVNHTLALLRTLLASLIPVVVLIACLGGAWLSGRALKPVRDLSAAAMRISIDNLSERLPEPHTRDELADLTGTLNSMLARLETAVATLAQFAADASHELRTPLAVIRTSAELALRRERSTESYQATLREVVGEASRMTELVEDLLLLARHGAALPATPFSAVDLRDILRDVGLEVQWLAQARGVRIETGLPPEPVHVLGHQLALHRLFLALVDNAVKYSPHQGTVFVEIERSADVLSAVVRDSGPGISSNDLPHIFKRFYRANGSHDDHGHGLGLALAQTIARAHGTVIEVQTEEGRGSTFRVRFAAADASRPAEQQVPA